MSDLKDLYKLRERIIFVFAVIVLTLLSFAFMAGTLAKYTINVVAEDSVLSARFDIFAEDGDGTKLTYPNANRINLFSNATTKATGTVATDDDGDMYLAPGVFGSFKIVLNTADCDVDIETNTSTVTATTVNGTLDVNQDEFISFKVCYFDEIFSDEDPRSLPQYLSATDTFVVNRVSLSKFCEDIESCLVDLAVRRNSGGTIVVYWTWIDLKVYDEEDTLLGRKWGAGGLAPTVSVRFGLNISQIVRTSGDNTPVVYSTPKTFQFGG